MIAAGFNSAFQLFLFPSVVEIKKLVVLLAVSHIKVWQYCCGATALMPNAVNATHRRRLIVSEDVAIGCIE